MNNASVTWSPSTSCIFCSPLFPITFSCEAWMPNNTALSKGLEFMLDHDGTTMFFLCVCWHLALQGVAEVYALWAGHFKGKTWLSQPFAVGTWHWQSVCTAASFSPAHKGAHASVLLSANWWLALFECVCVRVCVCVCVCVYLQQALAKRFVWASVGRAGHSSIPSHGASIIQFPRMLQPIPIPLHTCMHTHTHAQTCTPILDTHNL